MKFEFCGFTRKRNDNWRRAVKTNFPTLDSIKHDDFLCMVEYVEVSPQKYFAKNVYHDYLAFLTDLKKSNPSVINDFVVKQSRDLNLALRILSEINSQPIHDIILPLDEPQVYLTLNNIIAPNYLRLVEGVYAELIYPIALSQLRAETKGEDCLSDIYGRVQTLERTQFSYLLENYNATMRNGIAHGDVSFVDHDVAFRDKKGTTYLTGYRDVIRMFDRLLDQCNAMSAALKTFVLKEPTNSISLPRQILVDELKYALSFKHWEVVDVAESTFDKGQSQFNVFIKTTFIDNDAVNYYCFRTVEHVERFVPGFKRYFLSIESANAPKAWSSFDGWLLGLARTNLDSTKVNVIQAIENGAVFFYPRIKLPRFVHRLMRFWQVMQAHFTLLMQSISPPLFVSALLTTHRSGLWAIVRGDVICRNNTLADGRALVEAKYMKIARQALKEAQANLSWHDMCLFLPVGLLHIGVYASPLRTRQFKTGLIPELICTIEIKRLRRIRNTDIMGTVEQKGKFRIVWNDNYGKFGD